MKIAYILGSFPVLSETFIVREILELQRIGHEVLVFAQNNTVDRLSGNIIHEDAEKLIKDVCYFSTLRSQASKPQLVVYHLFLFLLNPFKYIRALFFSIFNYKKTFQFFLRSVVYIKEIKKIEADHIRAHFALESTTFAMLISMITNIPYSFTIHAYDIFNSELSELVGDKFNKAKFVASISKFNKRYIQNNYPVVNADKIKIVHCGIDVQNYNHETKMENQKKIILAVGRLTEKKGFKYLVQACSVLKNQFNLNFECRIIGEGKQRCEIEEMISQFSLEDVVLLSGAMDQKGIMDALRNAYLFVLPCITMEDGLMDGIPVALMEAMAMEVPVISTRVSGIPELVTNNCGILVDQKDSEGLALAINNFFLSTDEKIVLMKKNGKKVIEDEFNLVKEVRKLAELFES